IHLKFFVSESYCLVVGTLSLIRAPRPTVGIRQIPHDPLLARAHLRRFLKHRNSFLVTPQEEISGPKVRVEVSSRVKLDCLLYERDALLILALAEVDHSDVHIADSVVRLKFCDFAKGA